MFSESVKLERWVEELLHEHGMVLRSQRELIGALVQLVMMGELPC